MVFIVDKQRVKTIEKNSHSSFSHRNFAIYSNRPAMRAQYWRMAIPMMTVQRMSNKDPKPTTNHCTKPKGGMSFQSSLKSTSISPDEYWTNFEQWTRICRSAVFYLWPASRWLPSGRSVSFICQLIFKRLVKEHSWNCWSCSLTTLASIIHLYRNSSQFKVHNESIMSGKNIFMN